MKANPLLKQNIDALLRGRHESRKGLALYCRRSESWISKLFKEEHREVPFKYLDRIAEFFGLSVYELFLPGVSTLTERRSSIERRQNGDRRVGHPARNLEGLRVEYNKAHQSSSHGAPAVRPTAPPEEPLHRFVAKFEADLARYLADETRRQTTAPRVDLPKASAGNRKPRRSRAKTG